MKLKERIVALQRIRASELQPHPQNWRTHPREQRDALRGVLAEIGIADALIVRRLRDGGYQILDGHCRAEEAPDAEWPCLVVDLNDDEAKKLLATHDPIGAMAEADAEALRELLDTVETESTALRDVLGALESSIGEEPYGGEPVPVPNIEGWDEPETSLRLIIMCKNEKELEQLHELLGLTPGKVTYAFEEVNIG